MNLLIIPEKKFIAFCIIPMISWTENVKTAWMNEKFKHWEHFNNFNSPIGALNGKTPYDELKSNLNEKSTKTDSVPFNYRMFNLAMLHGV
jgi:hypothetical protein